MRNTLKEQLTRALTRRGWVNTGVPSDVSRSYSEIASEVGLSGDDLIKRYGRLGLPRIVPTGAIGIELGVAAGHYSDVLLSVGNFSRLYSIDAWADHHDSAEYIRCVSLLAKYRNRSVVMRMFFEDALSHFADRSVDFIYVDAYAHTGQEDGNILRAWYPKLATGGIFAGHDYDEQAWPQTVAAVDSFAAESGKVIEVVPGFDGHNWQDRHPSWYFTK